MRSTSLLPLAASLAAAANSTMPQVVLDYCTVQAAAANTTVGYYKYQNIRFAAVPTGDLRWAEPQWPPIETEINVGDLADSNVDCSSTEDCLYMDIWAPANSTGKKLPVIVWTYGGGFSAGSKSQNTPEGLFDLSTEFVFVAYNYRLGFVPGAGHHHAEVFWQNISTAVGCSGGDVTCMRTMNFTTLQDTATTIETDYVYQYQPRVDGLIIADTYESQLYQGRFNFSGPLMISHEQHEANSQAWSGVDTEDDIITELRVFFPSITDDVITEAMSLYPADDYTSAGLRFSDMKQSLDLTAHNLALTHALNNDTWNAMVALDSATHGTDQTYIWYSTYTLSSTTTTTESTASDSAASSGVPSSSTTGSSAAPSSSNSSNSTTTTAPGGSTTSVNSTIAIMMQKYMLSFVLTGNPNTMWPEDKLYWPKYLNGTEDAYTQLVFNDTFTLAADDLAANGRALFWNKALWY